MLDRTNLRFYLLPNIKGKIPFNDINFSAEKSLVKPEVHANLISQLEKFLPFAHPLLSTTKLKPPSNKA